MGVSDNSEYFMQVAIDLAKKGGGYVHPNPLVGCVIVLNNTIVSQGYHQYYGGNHAEVNAILQLEQQGFHQWNEVELYVTLEPCAHFGKTPPCTDLILKKGIKKVIIATTDINPLVAGKGIERLKKNGVSITLGIKEKEAIELNKRFFTYHRLKRPYIILKWAETKDGFISKYSFSQKNENIISGKETLKLVHQWRSEEHSILIGYNTLVKDNPYLNVRYVEGKNPIKIVVCREIPEDIFSYNMFKGTERVILFNTIKEEESQNILFKKINWENKEQEIIQHLYELNIVSVLIEGGTKTLQAFINQFLFDEIRVLKSKKVVFNEGIKAPISPQSLILSHTFENDTDSISIWKRD